MSDLQKLLDHYTCVERREAERRQVNTWVAAELDRRWHDRRLEEKLT